MPKTITEIRKEFEKEIAEIDCHYLLACSNFNEKGCEITVIGEIFEKYAKKLLEQK